MRVALAIAVALALSTSMAWAVVSSPDGLVGATAGTSPNPDYVPTVGGHDYSNYWVETSGGGSTGISIYDGDDYVWLPTPNPDTGNIAVKALIEMWCQEYLSANSVVFHQAGPGVSQSVTLTGWLKSNNGQYWGVSKGTWGETDQADADNLYFVEDVLRRTTTPNTPTIPISWELDDGSGFVAGTWSGGNNQQDWGYWWLLDGGATGNIPFSLKITITPDEYQDDGIYELDPSLVATPAL